jgi:hypothetical protein
VIVKDHERRSLVSRVCLVFAQNMPLPAIPLPYEDPLVAEDAESKLFYTIRKTLPKHASPNARAVACASAHFGTL